jgi:hypothetical protein
MINFLKVFFVLLAISGSLMAVQATDSATLPINAELATILSIEVKTPGLHWDLDPAKSPLLDDTMTKEKGVFVSTNMVEPWTVTPSGEILNDGTNKLGSFMTLRPNHPDWGDVHEIDMKSPDVMWVAKGTKGVDKAALGFTQPVSWEDIPSDGYKTVLTFTVSF